MKKIITLLLIGLAALTLGACDNTKEKEHDYEMKVMLDYVTNTNHAGLYYAKEKGYFEDEDYNLEIIESGAGDSLSMLSTDKIDFAYSYEENIIFSQDIEDKMPVKAISSIIDYNTSGFLYKKSLNIETFADFSGKTYGSWNSDLELAIISSLEEQYNLAEDIKVVSAITGSIADLDNGIDFLWIFEGWDMTLLDSQEKLDDYQFMSLKDMDSKLDFYTPLIASKNNVNTKKATDFLNILERGYKECFANQDECADILVNASSELDKAHVKKSLEYLENKIIVDGEFGKMEESKWTNFRDWLHENNVIESNVEVKGLFTNEYL